LSIRILFNPINREITANRGDNLLERMRDEDIRIEALCGGKGQCGKCKVILERGNVKKKSSTPDKFLSSEELEQGYYLACMVELIEDCEFTIPAESRIENPKILLSSKMDLPEPKTAVDKFLTEPVRKSSTSLLLQSRGVKLKGYKGPSPRISEDINKVINEMDEEKTYTATVSRTKGFPEIILVEKEDTREEKYGLAIDIGTTTVVAILVDLSNGDILENGSAMNKQITYGEDLVTRIAYTRKEGGLKKLQGAVVETINEIVLDIQKKTGIALTQIMDVSVGGNTVMNHLFAGIESTYLELANIEVPREPIIVKAKDVNMRINPETYIYCLPNVSRFLGGDAIGDVLAGDMHNRQEMSLMVDLGTNGEVIFGNEEWLFSASCASGPAFEGEGVRHGIRASIGGIDHIKIEDETKNAVVSIIGDSRAKGICGSGLIDLVAELFRVGLLDFAGKLVPGKPNIREGKWGLEYVVVPEKETSIGKDIVLTQHDLDYVIDSKAAACGAITVLMKKLKIGINDVENIFLAGAFGTFTDLENAKRLGIFPEFPNGTVTPIGNGSLSGAYATLMSTEKRKEALEVAKRMVYIDLLVDIEFIDEYSKALYLPGDKEYFPTLSRG
jgi:uncharacterized 2Fe-2S/4Fe-4S cluster protein (DUF4445 family)